MTQPTEFPFGGTVPQNYERFFVPVIGRPLAEDLLKEAVLQAGERVLDVGCGTGVVTRLAAEHVGPQGVVAGLDVNPGMLAVAASVTPSHLAIQWHEASAEAIPLDDGAFDVVLCQLSLQFMTDRSRALREMHRVLATGGRIVLSVAGPAAPLFETLADGLAHHVAEPAAGFVRAVFSLHDESEIARLLTTAGFDEVATHAYTRELVLPAAKDFLRQYIGSTPLAGIVAAATHEARSAMEREVVAEWKVYEEDDEMPYRQRVVMATAAC